MIRKVKNTYVVISEATGRRMGTYATLAEAKKRLRQIEFFKHLKANPRLQQQLRKKSLIKKPRKRGG